MRILVVCSNEAAERKEAEAAVRLAARVELSALATFLVDRQGNIKFMDTGFKPEEQAAKLRNAIQSLL